MDQTLVALDISDNGISGRGSDDGSEAGGGGVEHLAEMVSTSVALRSLDLSYNNLRGPGFNKLAMALSESSNLNHLNLSWSGLDCDSALEITKALNKNMGLKHLDLGHNRIQDRGTIALIQCLREKHTLESLILDYNAIGQNGGAAISHAISNPTGCSRYGVIQGISIIGSLFQSQGKRQVADGGAMPGSTSTPVPPTPEKRKLWYHYGLDKLTDRYILDLSNAYERAIAVRMVEQAFLEEGDNWKEETFNGQKFDLEEGESPEDLWDVPWEGVLSFTYMQTKMIPTEKSAVSDEVMLRLEVLIRQRIDSLGIASVMEFLTEMAPHLYFTFDQATAITSVLGNSQYDYAALWAVLYPRIVGFKKHREKIIDKLKPETLPRFVKDLGAMWYTNPDNPTGHYRLDLAVEVDRQCALRLQEFSNEERDERKRLKLFDLSQKGNGENWRNEKYKKRPFTVTESYLIPDEGVLEFDYISMRRPPGEAEAIPDDEFQVWFKELQSIRDIPQKLSWMRWASTRPTKAGHPTYFDAAQIATILWHFPGHKQPLWGPDEVLTEEEKEARKEAYLEAEEERRAEEAELAKLAAKAAKGKKKKKKGKKGKGEDLPPLEDEGDARYRAEAAIMLWGRLVDEEDSNIMCEPMSDKEYRDKLLTRLGHLTLFNPIKPNNELMARYVINLENYEEVKVADALFSLGKEEPGENNFIKCSMKDKKGKVKELKTGIPAAWMGIATTEKAPAKKDDKKGKEEPAAEVSLGLPEIGVLEFTFVETVEDGPLDGRVRVAEKTLGWSFPNNFLEAITLKRKESGGFGGLKNLPPPPPPPKAPKSTSKKKK